MCKHVLIIEDDRYSGEVLSQFLALHKISYAVIQDPSTLESADLDQVDIIFLDLEMPRLNGYELFEILKRKYRVNAPIIACTVHANEMDTVRRIGFDGFISKPLDGDRFEQQLLRLLNGQPVWENY
jgi:two-component system cell cycle response regulator DivK